MLRALLAGRDGPGESTPPLGELLDPVPLAALVALGLNDWLLKGRAPGWLTGKLSDFAGLLFFPLLLTAGFDTVLWLSRRGDCSLGLRKLGVALAVTAAGFMGWKALGVLGAVRDPGDLVALVMLVPAWLVGRGEVARVPLGRLEVLARRGGGADALERGLADVARLRPEDRAGVRMLAERLAAWLATRTPDDAAAVRAALARLRCGKKGK